MAFLKRIYTFFVVFILFVATVRAQNKPIGSWVSHLPYNTALGVATDGTIMYTVCEMGFYTLNYNGDAPQPYSKVDGMSDIGMQTVGYDATSATAILVYANGNIDLFKNNTFYNIPDLKIKAIAGSKVVHNVYTENGTAYLSTSIGTLVLDMGAYTVSETYQFIQNNGQVIPISYFMGSGGYFYAATSNGLYRANKSNPELQNFQVWQRIDSLHQFTGMVSEHNILYLCDSNKVYNYTNDTLKTIYTSSRKLTRLDSGLNRIFIGEFTAANFSGSLKIMDAGHNIIDSFACGKPNGVVQLVDSTIWLADGYNGLGKEMNGVSQFYHYPAGPSNYNSFDIYANNKNVWIAHGGYGDGYKANNWGFGMSNLANDKWKSYEEYSYAPFGDSVTDLVSILKDEKDGTVYTGSMVSGLFILKQNGDYQIVKQNSIFDTSTQVFGSGQREVMGLALDKSDNLWVSTAFSQHQLYVRTPDSVWYKFRVPMIKPTGGPLLIDDNNQAWFAAIGGSGVGIYYAGDLTVTTDDASYNMTTGVGFGNLPSNNVYCLAKDKNNNIWIGTDNGIGIVSNCNSPFTQSTPCDAEIPIVQYDQFAGYLFAGSNVRTIAVDGANRKWVGTDNGIWLLSPDASQIVYRFTADNSPLPSNVIEKIAVDPVTGDVYIGTDHGLISYRSTATDGQVNNADVLAFPNPVPSGYGGTIAIKGLAANADVRITDIDGQLVYRTKALGGQAVWNGLDYTGHRPQTGVYIVFVASSDGSQTYTGKIVFMQ